MLQINFRVAASREAYQAACTKVASAIAEVPGLLWKSWVYNQAAQEAGGIYLFEDAPALNAYLQGPIVAGLKSNPVFSEMSIKRWEVLPELSATTRFP